MIIEEEKNMACFLIPTAEAIVTTVVRKVIEKKEKQPEETEILLGGIPEKSGRGNGFPRPFLFSPTRDTVPRYG